MPSTAKRGMRGMVELDSQIEMSPRLNIPSLLSNILIWKISLLLAVVTAIILSAEIGVLFISVSAFFAYLHSVIVDGVTAWLSRGEAVRTRRVKFVIPGITIPHPENVGIIALEVYFTNQVSELVVRVFCIGIKAYGEKYVDQVSLEEHDEVSAGRYTIGLGQKQMSFCDDREDINSIALTTLSSLMSKYSIDPLSIGRLEVGTETILDKSKSCKSVLMQFFEPSGNTNIEGVDNLNACYGGTNALFNAVNWIESSGWDGRKAIVVAGGIALYDSKNARPTGGAGCVAALIGPDAPLAFETGRRGACIKHEYDFYKPNLASEYPYVDGQHSIKCYLDALDSCYSTYQAKSSTREVQYGIKRLDLVGTSSANGEHSKNTKESNANTLHGKRNEVDDGADTNDVHRSNGEHYVTTDGESSNNPHFSDEQHKRPTKADSSTFALFVDTFDYLVFHSPTCKLVTKAYARLLYNDFLSNPIHPTFSTIPPSTASQILNTLRAASFFDKTIEKTFLALSATRFAAAVQPSLNLPTNCGNMYCASVYSALISLICGVESDALVGKRVGLYSYGGGMAASLFTLRVRGDLGAMAKSLDLQTRLGRRKVEVGEWLDACKLRENAYGQKAYTPKGDIEKLAPGTWYLTEVDDQYHRSYSVKD